MRSPQQRDEPNREHACDARDDTAQDVTPNTDTPNAETSNAETSNAETSNADTTNADTTNADTTNADTTNADTPPADTSNADTPRPTADSIVIEPIDQFDDMGLRSEVYRGILSYGYEKPSEIQKTAIPAFVQHSKDIIAQAQSGTGKTATFSVALLQKIDETQDTLQGIILAPTRELATQIHSVITNIGQFTKIRIELVSGGGNVRRLVDTLYSVKPHVLVATPGRVLHLLRERYINTRRLKYFIMDEADQMLSEDFQEQVRTIIQQVPKDAQIGLYSATMSPEMDAIAKQFLTDPIQIRVEREMLTLEGIRQYKIVLNDDRWKFDTLMDLYSSISIYQMMIYCNSKRSVDYLCDRMYREQIPCDGIHGQMMGEQRTDIMKRFRSGDLRVLVTTDLTARGIDVQQVSLVINYDFPQDIATYLHRIGRGGRFGRKGFAINFVVDDGGRGGGRGGRYRQSDLTNLRQVVEHYQTQIDEMPNDLKTALSLE